MTKKFLRKQKNVTKHAQKTMPDFQRIVYFDWKYTKNVGGGVAFNGYKRYNKTIYIYYIALSEEDPREPEMNTTRKREELRCRKRD